MMRKKENSQKNSVLRNVMVLIFLLLSSWIVWLNLQKRILINQENRGIEQMEAGKYSLAIGSFQQVFVRLHKEKDQQRVRNYMADCYLALAENPENNYETSMLYYRRLYRMAPQKIPPAIKQIIEKKEQKHMLENEN
ncbi:MAG: tetratricopeptide repeat protein [Lentisphaerae bacterium]|nr:tetratricopeptide repeat protein [Lentisphaerota bacterium]